MSKPFLDRIPDLKTLRKFDPNQLLELAKNLRQAIIEALAKGEGHLGSSLGTVELSIALHFVFNTPKDLLIWDVGHQAYGHKMLTGRKDSFDQLRQQGGISGFPKRDESPFDAFGTGHAGTSISAALGMALSAQLQGVKKHHIAVIGDASIANGMAFEALNHLGTTSANVLIVLNDNSMGIDPSVGALKNYFDSVKTTESSLPNFFKNLNIAYSGPLDGHNIDLLIKTLTEQKKQLGPRLIHIVTKKGKGLPLAENKQITYHAPGKFDPVTGKLNPANGKQKIKFQEVFGKTLLHLAQHNSRIVAITPAMPTGSGLVELMQEFPDRCIDVGIAEQHAVTLAAGMATQGILPFCVIYSTFLQRAYDQLIHDVALQKLPVVICVDRAGIVGHDGPTHHGVFDIVYLRCIPNLTIAAPRNAQELQNLLYTAQLGLNQPLAIRYPRGYSQLTELNFNFKKIEWGKGQCLKTGDRYAILSVGTLAEAIEEALTEVDQPENFAHYDLGFVKPLDTGLLHEVFTKYKRIVFYEEGSIKGGAGSAVLEFAAAHHYTVPIDLEGVPDEFISHGNSNKLFQNLGLDAQGICKKLNSLSNKNKE
ncbi:1-deoxy-D-xylulose-5-phosphate synthase [Flavobacteriaceae bacterium]|nr:1-deoxy-D-xylulose-5-phosphate synthase [Flavobacteriaceae bacterium]MDB3862263.1 1-deoxy-D-xylulose-5-phosphate synthase [Flavobacteriaceae bacterium]